MASPVWRPGENLRDHMHTGTALKFFKIILNPRAHGLKIPTEFTRRYGLVLPNRVFLRAPNGPAFRVELINSNGETWLQKGWHEFKEYYSVGFGHFLVFDYDRNSHFHVLIFGMTASEIEYPVDANYGEGINFTRAAYRVPTTEDTGSESDDSVAILKQPLMNKKGKEKISDEGDQTVDDVSVQVLGNPGKRKTRERAVDKETSIAYQRAKAFKSDNQNQNPYFISLMQPSYVSYLFVLAIPASIARENLPDKDNDIKLRVSDGKTWSARCSIQAPNARITSGWKRFVKDNALKRIPAEFRKRYGQNLPNPVFLKVPSGSTLEVELIQSNGETWLQKGWQVFKERYSIGFGHFLVFKYNGNSQFDVLIFDTTASEIEYPFDANYEADMDYKRVAYQVPKIEEFLTGNRGKGIAENLEDTDQTENDVSIEALDNPLSGQQNRRKRWHSDDTIEFSGDYPVRKSVKGTLNISSCFKKDSRSKVSTLSHHSERIPPIRVKLDESTSGLNFRSLKPKLKKECIDGIGRHCSDRVQIQRAVVKETCIAYQKAIAFISGHTSQNPVFISLMQPSYVSNKFSLNVPLSFAKGNLLCKGANSTILVTNGKKWSVRCMVGEVHAKLSSGWKDFVQDNALKVGDACIFEVAKRNKLVWNVIIFRS
ncbi:hypothetical protein Pfo_008750 [Paulownia fortunei]|nr:hypothetical protein Pfo_008750 [Paulownia fortunei]